MCIKRMRIFYITISMYVANKKMSASYDRMNYCMFSSEKLPQNRFILLPEVSIHSTIYERVDGTAQITQESVCKVGLSWQTPFPARGVNVIITQIGIQQNAKLAITAARVLVTFDSSTFSLSCWMSLLCGKIRFNCDTL